jgi:hypothetical protein
LKLRLFILLACGYLIVASREQPWGDANVVYHTTESLLTRGKLDVAMGGPPQFYATRNGKKYGVFPLGNVVAMAPGFLAFQGLRHLPAAPAELLYRYTSHLPTSLMVAGACLLFFAMARREGASQRAAVWLTLALGWTTVLAVYARAPYSEALQTLAFTWVVERTLAMGERMTLRGMFFLGVACGLLFNTKLVYAVGLCTVPVYLVARHRRGAAHLAAGLFYAAVPALLLAAGALLHNHLKTGTLSDTGYSIPGGVFSGDAFAALDGFFLSPGKSIFLYSPPLLLGLCAFPSYLRAQRPRALFLLAFTGVVTLVNAKFRYWHADFCWGPRLLVPLTPAWMIPAAHWIEGALARGRAGLRAAFVGALVGAGLWVQVLGASFYWDHYIRIAISVKDQTGATGWYGEDLHHCHFIPQFSPIVGHAWMLRHALLLDDDILADAPWKRVVGGPVNLVRDWQGVRLDWWGLDWFGLSPPPRDYPPAYAWGAALALLLLGLGGWSALGIRRRLR